MIENISLRLATCAVSLGPPSWRKSVFSQPRTGIKGSHYWEMSLKANDKSFGEISDQTLSSMTSPEKSFVLSVEKSSDGLDLATLELLAIQQKKNKLWMEMFNFLEGKAKEKEMTVSEVIVSILNQKPDEGLLEAAKMLQDEQARIEEFEGELKEKIDQLEKSQEMGAEKIRLQVEKYQRKLYELMESMDELAENQKKLEKKLDVNKDLGCVEMWIEAQTKMDGLTLDLKKIFDDERLTEKINQLEKNTEKGGEQICVQLERTQKQLMTSLDEGYEIISEHLKLVIENQKRLEKNLKEDSEGNFKMRSVEFDMLREAQAKTDEGLTLLLKKIELESAGNGVLRWSVYLLLLSFIYFQWK